ncbi:hypothetical protein C8F01DRAFT_1262467 [Mycena amicta]|nr:hypothetical protein C8F01DRAFT_1262467 [Mycena amicta]
MASSTTRAFSSKLLAPAFSSGHLQAPFQPSQARRTINSSKNAKTRQDIQRQPKHTITSSRLAGGHVSLERSAERGGSPTRNYSHRQSPALSFPVHHESEASAGASSDSQYVKSRHENHKIHALPHLCSVADQHSVRARTSEPAEAAEQGV